MGTKASVSQRCPQDKIRSGTEAQPGAHSTIGVFTNLSRQPYALDKINLGARGFMFYKVSDITKITFRKLRNEGVYNFTRGVGGIVKFSRNKQFLAIYIQSVIFASFDHAKEEIIDKAILYRHENTIGQTGVRGADL